MAPEQLVGVPASVQSEIYSLGLLLYELYTGKPALRGQTLDELRREHEEGDPIHLPRSSLTSLRTASVPDSHVRRRVDLGDEPVGAARPR